MEWFSIFKEGVIMLVTDFRCWWQPESVIKISNLSPTHFVSKIRHQHRCNQHHCHRRVPHSNSINGCFNQSKMTLEKSPIWKPTQVILIIFQVLLPIYFHTIKFLLFVHLEMIFLSFNSIFYHTIYQSYSTVLFTLPMTQWKRAKPIFNKKAA